MDIKCPYCDAVRPQPGTQSCGCGATVFDKPKEPTREVKSYRNMTFQGSSFKGRDLRNADFSGARLQGCNFQGADLRGTKFTGATLQGCNLYEAQMEGANFDGATMQGVRH